MIDKPEIVHTETQRVAVIHVTVPRSDIQQVMGPAIQEVMAAVQKQGAGISGPVFSHHLKMDPDVFDFEVGVPVGDGITADGRVTEGTLPAAIVARTTYHGPYEGLGEAWHEFGEWISEQGHTPAPDLWECYVTGPESSSDPADWRTQLNRPVERATSKG